jgi:hypothetical protein
MKATILALTLSAKIALAVVPASGPGTNWVISIDAPTNGMLQQLTNYVAGTNQAYKVYGTNDLAAPIQTWPLLSVVTNWAIDSSGSVPRYVFPITGVSTTGQWFFAVTPTNIQGEGSFSVPFQTGPVWQRPQNPGLQRGP